MFNKEKGFPTLEKKINAENENENENQNKSKSNLPPNEGQINQLPNKRESYEKEDGDDEQQPRTRNQTAAKKKNQEPKEPFYKD